MMQRAPKYVCKKDMNPPDDNFDGPSATVVNFPKEFQGTYISKNDFILTYFKKCIYLNENVDLIMTYCMYFTTTRITP